MFEEMGKTKRKVFSQFMNCKPLRSNEKMEGGWMNWDDEGKKLS